MMISMSGLDWSWAEKPKKKRKPRQTKAAKRETQRQAFKSLQQEHDEMRAAR